MRLPTWEEYLEKANEIYSAEAGVPIVSRQAKAVLRASWEALRDLHEFCESTLRQVEGKHDP